MVTPQFGQHASATLLAAAVQEITELMLLLRVFVAKPANTPIVAVAVS